ncbi:MAG: TVP38/TMEM64 family protein [Rhodothermales bacterium]
MERSTEQKQSRWTWLIPLGILAVLVGLYFAWPSYHAFIDKAYGALSSGSQQEVQQWVNGYGPWGFAVILGLMFMQTVLAFLPSLLIMVVAVLAYGPVVGGFLAWGGLLLAACLGYGIGRSFGPVIVDRLIGAKAERKMEHFVERYGLWGIVAARISPILSTDAVSIVAGLVGMRFWRFVLATAAGTLPLAVLVAWLGADIDRLKTGLIWVSVVSLVIFVGYVVYDRQTSQHEETA